MLNQSNQQLRRSNRALVLQRLRNRRFATRTQLAGATGLTPMAISRIVRELLDARLVEEVGDHGGTRGRPKTDLRIAGSGAFVVGVAVSAYEQTVSLAIVDGTMIDRRPLPAACAGDPATTIAATAQHIEAMLMAWNIPRHRVLGVACGIAGVVDQKTGSVLEAPYIGWSHVPVVRDLEAALGLPVVAENVNNALLLGEVRFGDHIGQSDAILVRVATGLGGSFLVEGRLVRGVRSAAGQIGHLTVDGGSIACACGRRGCLNTVASGWAVLADLGLATPPAAAPARVHEHARAIARVVARANDGALAEVQALRRAGRRLGKVLQRFATALDPRVCLLVGPVAASRHYVAGVRAAWQDRSTTGTHGCAMPVAAAMEPPRAAVCLALHEFVDSPRLHLQRLLRGVPQPTMTQPAVSAAPLQSTVA